MESTDLIAAMRRKFSKLRSTSLYYMKARTSWELVETFNNSENWHESLKRSKTDDPGHDLIKVEEIINATTEASCPSRTPTKEDSKLTSVETHYNSVYPVTLKQRKNNTGLSRSSKKHACTICNKRFSLKSTLNIHLKTHSGEKAYSCTVCLKSFIQNTDLVRHSRIHSGQKPFHCKICGRSFSQKVSLQTHARIHTGVRPFACSECTKTFRDLGGLRRHLLVHSKEKPYPCEKCGKGFARRTHLKRHFQSKAHTGEK